jgi:hypothetical protein
MPYANSGGARSQTNTGPTTMPSISRATRILGAIAALCLCQFADAARIQPRYGVFVYSNRCVSAMSGDAGGDRITLHRFADGDTLVYEYADGSTHAVLAHDVMIDNASGGMRFQVDIKGTPSATVYGAMATDGERRLLATMSSCLRVCATSQRRSGIARLRGGNTPAAHA